GHRLHPLREARLELPRVAVREDTAKGVVRRDAMRHVAEGPEPARCGVTNLLDLHPALRSADHATQGIRHDGQQRMALGPLHPRILQHRKVLHQARHPLLTSPNIRQSDRIPSCYSTRSPPFTPPLNMQLPWGACQPACHVTKTILQ